MIKGEELNNTREIIKDKMHAGTHWLILFDHDQAAQHVMLFERLCIGEDKTGFDVYSVPLVIENIGGYVFNMLLVSKDRVTPSTMAAFMSKITGRGVSVSDIEDLQQLAWADDEQGKLLFHMLDIVLGNDTHEITGQVM